MTYDRKMTTDDSTVHKRGHLASRAAVPVWKGTVIYPRANVRLDEVDHLSSKGLVRQGGCRP